MLALLALVPALALDPPAPVTLDAVVSAFDAACVATGADLAAQRNAILGSGARLSAPQSTAPASIEMYERGAISYIVAPSKSGSSCAILARVDAGATVAELTPKLVQRFSVKPKSTHQSKSGLGNGYWKIDGRIFSYEISDQSGLRGVLLSAISKGS